MRHQNKKITLGRKAPARKALLTNLAESLILFEKIITTKAKAKATKSLVERLVTKSKDSSLKSRRELLSVLFTKNAVSKLLEQLGPRYKDRKGGYTRLTLLSERKGDGAEQAVVEFV
jgi:large subunit ribosomal protein L17